MNCEGCEYSLGTSAGISTKILFSLTCGTPVLTTQEGLSGMPVIDLDRTPTPFFIVNTAGNGDYVEEFLTYYLTEETWQSKQTLTHGYIHEHVVETHFSWSTLSKVAVYEMFKVWHLKNHNGTRNDTLPSQWETNQAFDAVMNGFIRGHGARNFSAADYI